MPTHASLGAAIQAAATAQPTVSSQIAAGVSAIEAWILAKGRSFIDTPEERSALEAEAVQAFNAIFAKELGPAVTAIVDGFVMTVIDKLLTYLAATPTIPAPTPDPPAPVAPHPPIGSAGP